MEYDFVAGRDISRLAQHLTDKAAFGWEVASSHCTHSFGVGGETWHYIIIRRKLPDAT
jgi:hypothetical protein